MSRPLVAIGALVALVVALSSSSPAAEGPAVQVVEFDMAGAQVDGIDGDTSTFGMQAAESIAAALREKGTNAVAVARAAARTAPTVVEGRVAVVDGGSRAARFFVKYGAGGARVSVEGRTLREGKVVGEFQDERRSSGMKGFAGDPRATSSRSA